MRIGLGVVLPAARRAVRIEADDQAASAAGAP